MTHKQLIKKSLDGILGNFCGNNQYGYRHNFKWIVDKAPIARMVDAAAEYADHYHTSYDSKLGHDYVLGPEWEAIIRGIMGLLNGELDGLDGGTVDSLLRDMLRLEDIEPDN